MWHRPLRVICRTLCRAGPACPAGINAYCAAGHMGPALRIILRPLRCRASPTGGRRGGRPCPPAGDGTLDVPAGRYGHRPLRAICRTLCRAGPACPAGINAYCAAGHMGPALRIILRPLRCRASPTCGRRGGRPCPPAGDGALDVPAGRCGISPYGRFAAPLCRAGPACPAESKSYRAAGHMGPALRIILRPLSVQSITDRRTWGRTTLSARTARSAVIPSQ